MLKMTLFKSVSLIALLALTAGAAMIWLTKPAPTIGAAASLDYPDKIVITDAIAGDVTYCTIKLRNTGGTPLVIHSVKPSCSCSVVSWSNPVLTIQPGESLDALVSISLMQQVGATQTVSVHILSSDEEKPDCVTEIQIKSLRGFARVVPPTMMFDQLACGESKAARATVYADQSSDLKLLQVRSFAPDRFHAEIVQRVPGEATLVPGMVAIGTIEATPVAGYAGSLSGTIELELSGSKSIVLKVPVTGHRQFVLKDPPLITFLTIGTEPVATKIPLSLEKLENLKLSVSGCPVDFDAALAETASGTELVLTPKRNPSANRSVQYVRIDAKVDGKLLEVVSLPVVVTSEGKKP